MSEPKELLELKHSDSTLYAIVAKYTDQHDADMREKLLEAVGEDEQVKPNWSGGNFTGYDNTRAEARNDLRNELRSKINELYKEVK